MTQVDQVVTGLLTDLYIGGKAVPAAGGGRLTHPYSLHGANPE